ncbi:MAG: hypothetical protein Q8K89_13290 [Actinomycetota bacterium]|nr:hypothetical protein [Actinomycetota bacterium]
MSIILTAVLIIVGIVGAVVLLVAVPALFGMMAYDTIKSPKAAKSESRDSITVIAAERGVARAFVLLGGAFWSIAAFAGLYNFQETGASAALMGAAIPLVACAATLIVGWYYERFTAAILAVASFAVIAWGVVYGFEAGVWALMTFALIGPMATAAVLFWMARREQEAYELITATRPQLAFIFAARSELAA